MDPDANLSETLILAKHLASGNLYSASDGERLAELVLAMDEWLRSGGFLPEPWTSEP